MKIYSMTATFGKLEHATLEFKNGLNIIQAPNEWGKSTWCAFLTNMLYGIDTKARAKGTELPDKERYAPWSGVPMSGRILLNHQGRNITLERRSKGRIPFGEFRAYETDTGMDIPELTAANCGEVLLGVERTVFVRAGFIRFSDLPVTQDDALRRRLNNLVTTGDESGAGDRLGQTLKDLKNKCRHNQTGLLPQAERERAQLINQQDALYALQKRMETITQEQKAVSSYCQTLENHLLALQYEATLADQRQVQLAQEAAQDAQDAQAQQTQLCQGLDSQQTLEQRLTQGQSLLDSHLALQTESAQLPSCPQSPDIPQCYQTEADIVTQAQEDFAKHSQLEERRRKQNRSMTAAIITAAVLFAAGALGAYLIPFYASVFLGLGSGILLAASIGCGIFAVSRTKKFREEIQLLYHRHPGIGVDQWVTHAQGFSQQMQAYREQLSTYQAAVAAYEAKKQALEDKTLQLTGGKPLTQCQDDWRQALSQWAKLESLRRDAAQAQSHAQTLASMAKPLPPAPKADSLRLTQQETNLQLANGQFQLKQLQLELGQCQGKAAAIGQETTLRARLDTLNRRIARLEDTYQALEMAQEALREATSSLQRRFAPRISQRTQALFSRLTQGRYEKITLGQDLSLQTGAQNEDTLLSAQWRSDGTLDQLYLALRLAVAEELTPDAPLVLDDALVRFDDQRLKLALEILNETAQSKQVILFTCQGREKSL